MNTSTAIKVLIHVQPPAGYYVSIFTGKWRGALQWDRRNGPTRHLEDHPSCPRGVEAPLWLAYRALHHEVWRQYDEASPLHGEVTGHSPAVGRSVPPGGQQGVPQTADGVQEELPIIWRS